MDAFVSTAARVVREIEREGIELDKENPSYVILLRFVEEESSVWEDLVKLVKRKFAPAIYFFKSNPVKIFPRRLELTIERPLKGDRLKVAVTADVNYFRGRYVDRLFSEGHASDWKTYREVILPSLSCREGTVTIIGD